VQARRVLAEALLIEDLAREGRDELTGPLRLGAIYTVGPYLLPTLVPLLRQTAPAMPLVIEENFTARLLAQLRDNELDIAILALPVDLNGLSAWPLYDEEFVVLLPPEHRWAGERQIAAKKLAEEKLLLLGSGHCFREQVIEACPKCVDADADGPKPQTGSSLETIRYMVIGGLGITVLPRSSAENREASGEPLLAKPFAAPAPQRRIAMVWRKTFPRMKAIEKLREAIIGSGIKGVTLLRDAKPQEE
jgi:LysR family transcriptional regulator, hydrogen peroxide-inducible genes activator